MKKVYKIEGKTEVHEIFSTTSGKTKIKVTFSKGNLDPRNRVPARYSTDNPIVQAIIEASPKFNRSIFLEKTFEVEAPVVAPAAPVAPVAPAKGKAAVKAAKKADALREMPEVTTLADAATVLTAEGAPAADFDGTVEGALKIAKGLGLSFPNLKAE